VPLDTVNRVVRDAGMGGSWLDFAQTSGQIANIADFGPGFGLQS